VIIGAMTPCILVRDYIGFEYTYHFHFRCRIWRQNISPKLWYPLQTSRSHNPERYNVTAA